MKTPSTIKVRHATEADVDRVFKLITAIADYHDQAHYVLTDPAELLSSGFGADPKFRALLAEYDGEIVGLVSYTIDYSIWLGCEYMHIDDVFVDADYRSNNIGETLMLEARKLCDERGLRRIKWEVEIENHGARRFYEKLGAKYHDKGVFAWDWSK